MTTLYFEKQGRGIPLVLLHGWGMHGGVWQQCLSKLADRFSLYIVDLPGFGHSQGLTIDDDLASLAEPIVEAVGEPAIYLGWSLGGLVATYIASHYPDKVLGLIHVCSSPRFLAEENWPGMAPGLLDDFHQLLYQNYEKTIERFILLQLYQSVDFKKKGNQLKQLFFSRPAPQLASLAFGLKILQQTDQRNQLASIACPMVWLLGRLDSIVSVNIADNLTRLNSRMKTVIFPKATHMPFMTHPREFCQELTQFGAKI